MRVISGDNGSFGAEGKLNADEMLNLFLVAIRDELLTLRSDLDAFTIKQNALMDELNETMASLQVMEGRREALIQLFNKVSAGASESGFEINADPDEFDEAEVVDLESVKRHPSTPSMLVCELCPDEVFKHPASLQAHRTRLHKTNKE